MKKLLFFLLSILQFAPGNTQELTGNKIDAFVHEAASTFMSNTSRVGLSIGVLYKGKIYTYHYGTIEKGKRLIPTNNTIYEIGSITKTVTGTLLAQAVYDKKVNLDDDVQKYLGSQYSNLEYSGQPIRLFHLLNHTSRLPFMLPDKPELFKNPNYDSLPFILSAIEKNYTRQQFFEDLKKVKIDTIPGIKLGYSNSAAQLLGFILEQIYGMSYDELLIKYISGPLDMPHTGLTIAEKEKMYLAKGYTANGAQTPYSHSGAAGGINSTLMDMLNYTKFHLNESNPVVSLSHKPTWGDIQYYAIGLNWQMDHKADAPRRIFQSGGTLGFSSFLVAYPDLNIGIVLLSNESDQSSQGGLSEAAQKIFTGLTEK